MIGDTLTMVREERSARVALAAVAQSSLGTGAGYVALLIVAYDRWRSPWAITLILLAEFLPSMFFGPLCGTLADRWSRKRCVVLADLARMVAFCGVALAGSFELTLIAALLGGFGTTLFRPAMLAGISDMAAPPNVPAVTSVYGALTDIGYTVGPALAAVGLALLSPEAVLVVNGATFAVSAVVLALVPFARARTQADDDEPGIFRGTREAVATLLASRPIATLALIMSAAMLSGGVFNVIELPFAEEATKAGGSGYAALVAALGAGFLLGSLASAGGGDSARLRRRFVQGVALTGIGGVLAAAAAPSIVVATAAFALGGFGNGVFVAHQRLLIQDEVSGEWQGRAFALTDTFTSWAMAAAFLAGGALTSVVGIRALMAATGIWELGLAVVALVALRRSWNARELAEASAASRARQPDGRIDARVG